MDKANELQQKLQSAVEKMLDSIDKKHLRPMQKKSYLQMASCFDNNSASQSQLQSCVEKSALSIQNAQNVIQNEMNGFQGRLQRCVQSCQVIVSYPPNNAILKIK